MFIIILNLTTIWPNFNYSITHHINKLNRMVSLNHPLMPVRWLRTIVMALMIRLERVLVVKYTQVEMKPHMNQLLLKYMYCVLLDR